MNEKPRSSTSNPSGTMMSIPPQKAQAVISTSGPSISARRRSMSQPPMTATAFVFPLMRQRPLVLWPLMTATCHAASSWREAWWARAGVAVSRRDLGQVGHDRLEVAPGPGLEGRTDPFGELVEREPALDHVLPELGHGAVPIGVGHPLGQALRPGPCGGGGLSGTGGSAMRDSLPARPGRGTI